MSDWLKKVTSNSRVRGMERRGDQDGLLVHDQQRSKLHYMIPLRLQEYRNAISGNKIVKKKIFLHICQMFVFCLCVKKDERNVTVTLTVQVPRPGLHKPLKLFQVSHWMDR